MNLNEQRYHEQVPEFMDFLDYLSKLQAQANQLLKKYQNYNQYYDVFNQILQDLNQLQDKIYQFLQNEKVLQQSEVEQKQQLNFQSEINLQQVKINLAQQSYQFQQTTTYNKIVQEPLFQQSSILQEKKIQNLTNDIQAHVEEAQDQAQNKNKTLGNSVNSKETMAQIQKVLKRGHYKSYSKDLKQAVINASIRNGIKDAASQFKIPIKNIKRWIKFGSDRKTGGGRKTMDPAMEQSLYEWVSNHVSNENIQASSKLIRDQALQLTKFPNKFKASKGWVEKFLKRYNLKFMQQLNKSCLNNSQNQNTNGKEVGNENQDTFMTSQIKINNNQSSNETSQNCEETYTELAVSQKNISK